MKCRTLGHGPASRSIPDVRRHRQLRSRRLHGVIHRALDFGISFVDTANRYSNGESEEIVGKAIARDQGYAGPTAAEAAQSHGIRLEVVKHPMAKHGYVPLPRRWVVQRSFALAARFRGLVRDYERLDTTLEGFHYVAFACLMIASILKQLV
jgi:transposase